MPLAPLAILYTSEPDVQALLSVDGETASLDDNSDGTVNSTELGYLTFQGINWATSRINFYCQQLYDAVDLATSWSVNEWATILACRWVRSRRGNPVPQSLQRLYDEAIADLKMVRAQQAIVPDIGYRNQIAPAWSNMRLNPGYWARKLRVERAQSEPTQAQHSRDIDWSAEIIASAEKGL
jgi:hypothetical protein